MTSAASLPEIGITVVVPSYNQGRFIDETLTSLLEQDYPALEVIVIDGGSTDDTVARLRSWGNRISWVSEKDEGQSDAIAKGFRKARFSWITWLNSDDVQTDRALWRVAETIRRNPDVDVVVGRGHYMDAEGGNPRPYPTFDASADPKQELFAKGYVAQPSVYFRKSCYEAIGGIDRSLNFCMDYDLWVRFAIAGFRFATCDADISGNRWYETTKTAGQLLELLSEVAACQTRHFGRVSAYFVQAISDNLYAKFHSAHHGDRWHILYRVLYFKSVWLWLNVRQPGYCLKGLLMETIAKSGPLVGDRLTWADWFKGAQDLLEARRRKR